MDYNFNTILSYRLMPFRSDYLKKLTVYWPCTNFTFGNWPVIVSSHQRILDVEIYPNTWKSPKRLRNFSTMKEFIPQRFNQNLWRSKIYTQIRVSLKIYNKCAYIFFWIIFWKLRLLEIFFWEFNDENILFRWFVNVFKC